MDHLITLLEEHPEVELHDKLKDDEENFSVSHCQVDVLSLSLSVPHYLSLPLSLSLSLSPSLSLSLTRPVSWQAIQDPWEHPGVCGEDGWGVHKGPPGHRPSLYRLCYQVRASIFSLLYNTYIRVLWSCTPPLWCNRFLRSQANYKTRLCINYAILQLQWKILALWIE